jgi:hypothetical protein
MTFTFTSDQFKSVFDDSATFRNMVESALNSIPEETPSTLLKELKIRIATAWLNENKIGRIKTLRTIVQDEPKFQVLFVGKLVSYGDGTSTVGLAESKRFIENEMGNL